MNFRGWTMADSSMKLIYHSFGPPVTDNAIGIYGLDVW